MSTSAVGSPHPKEREGFVAKPGGSQGKYLSHVGCSQPGAVDAADKCGVQLLSHIDPDTKLLLMESEEAIAFLAATGC